MFGSWPILSTILASPLLGVLILLFLPKQNGRLLKTVGIAATLVPLLLAALLYADFQQELSGESYRETVQWIEIPLNKEAEDLKGLESFSYKFDYALAVNGVTLPLVFLTALLASMAALASVHIKKRWKAYYIWFLLLEVGMFGVFLAQDVFLFFLAFEWTLVPMFFLISIWGYEEREKAAFRFLLYNGLGSAILLIALLMLINTAGFTTVTVDQTSSFVYSGSLDVIRQNIFHDPSAFMHAGPDTFPDNPFYMSEAMKWTMFLMLLVAFGIKLPLVPFHTWMLTVHKEAHPSIVMIHSGVLLKIGAYGLITFGVLLFPAQAKASALALGIIGVVNVLYGALLAWRQRDLKLLLAYSSVSHMGIVILGIAAWNTIGMQGALFQMVSHGLISALLFLLVGSLYERTGTTEIDKMGGLFTSIPFVCGFLLLGGMASLGLPLLSGFISEWLALLGLFEHLPVLAVIGAIGIVLTAAYVLRGVMRITYGPIAAQHKTLRDARLIEAVPMVVLAAFIIVVGVYPAVLSDVMQQTLQGMEQWMHATGKIGG